MPAPERQRPAEEAAGRHRHRSRRPLALLAGAILALAVIAGVGAQLASARNRPSAGPPISSPSVVAPATISSAGSTPSAGPAGPTQLQAPAPALAVPAAPAVPVSVQVPSLGITSGLQPLGLLPDHSLQPPTEYGRAGWFADGVRPGAVGPAIIAGHVDSYQGPAIFYRLRQVTLGADVIVADRNGISRHFRVTDIQTYPKAAFPTEAVYGPTSLPVVRLVTCTGDFDASKRSYVDNLVVTATLDASRAG